MGRTSGLGPLAQATPTPATSAVWADPIRNRRRVMLSSMIASLAAEYRTNGWSSPHGSGLARLPRSDRPPRRRPGRPSNRTVTVVTGNDEGDAGDLAPAA